MIPRHLDPAWRGRFAGEAAAQRDSRARLYPGLIAAGRADRAKVEADWRAYWLARVAAALGITTTGGEHE